MHLGYMQKKADISDILHAVGLDNANQKPIIELVSFRMVVSNRN